MKHVMRKYAGVILGTIVIISITSCRHTPDVPSNPVVSFQNDVLPILGGNCNAPGCHAAGSDHKPLDTYDDVMKTVSAGDIYTSSLYQTITAQASGTIMPPRPQARLSDNQIATIEVWILQGAKNN